MGELVNPDRKLPKGEVAGSIRGMLSSTEEKTFLSHPHGGFIYEVLSRGSQTRPMSCSCVWKVVESSRFFSDTTEALRGGCCSSSSSLLFLRVVGFSPG